MNQHSNTVFFIAALILFSIYRRVRRNIGWQELRYGNLMFRTILFLIFGLVFLAEGFLHPISLISDIVGILLGVILAYYSTMITSFEQRDGRSYYRPNIWIGTLVTLIFLVRFVYRFYGIFSQGGFSGYQQGQTTTIQNISAATGNSWTSGLMLIMFAYYVIYYLFLMRKQKTFVTSK